MRKNKRVCAEVQHDNEKKQIRERIQEKDKQNNEKKVNEGIKVSKKYRTMV